MVVFSVHIYDIAFMWEKSCGKVLFRGGVHALTGKIPYALKC
jgi:hypothetical protein